MGLFQTTEEKWDDWVARNTKANGEPDLDWTAGLPACPKVLGTKQKWLGHMKPSTTRIKIGIWWITVPILVKVYTTVLVNPDPAVWANPTKPWGLHGHFFRTKYHPGAVYEMRSKAIANGAGQQATYDANYQLITNPHGWGSMDRKSPTVLFSGHGAADVDPFNWAYKLDGNTHGAHVAIYMTHRPPSISETTVTVDSAPRVTVPQPAPTPTPIGASNVQITHIFYDGLVPLVESDEYVEITNSGDAPQDLTGWVLKDIAEGYPSFTFPPYILEPGATVRVYTNEVHQEYGGFSFNYGKAIWNNKVPDTAALYNVQGKEISRQSYSV